MPPKHRHRSRSPAHHHPSTASSAASGGGTSSEKSKSMPKSPSLSSSSSGRHAPQLAPLEVKGMSYAAAAIAGASSESLPPNTLLERTPSDDPSLAAVQAMPDDGDHHTNKLPDANRDPSIYAAIKIADALPGIGRALAWKVAVSANIPNRLVSLMSLVLPPSLSQREWQNLPTPSSWFSALLRKSPQLTKVQAALNKVFDGHIAPFLVVNRDFPDVNKRIGYVRDQFHVVYVSWMCLSDETRTRVIAALKLQIAAKQKRRLTLSATTHWKLWGFQLLALFECMPSNDVARMMGVCKNWKLQAERNRIWRRLSIRNYPWQDDEDTPLSHGYRYWYHRYLVLMNTDRVAVRIKFGNTDQPAGVSPRPYLFDRGEAWSNPTRTTFEWLKYGWENTVSELARDRRQPWGHSSYGCVPTPGKANETFDKATLIHFHPWRPQADKWLQVFQRSGNYARLEGGSLDEEPRNWIAELPAGEYRISIAGGDVMMSSPCQLYANGQKVFTDAQAAKQIGVRIGVADVIVGPDRLLHVSCVPNLVPTSTWRCWCCSKLNLPQEKYNGVSSMPNNHYCQQCGVIARSTDANNSVKRHLIFETAPPRDTPGDSYYPSVHDHKWQPGRRLIGIQTSTYNCDASGKYNTGALVGSVKGFNMWYSSPVDPTHIPQKIAIGDYYSVADKKEPDASYAVRAGDPVIGVAVEFDDRKAGVLFQITFTTLSGQRIQSSAHTGTRASGRATYQTWVAPVGHCICGIFGISATDMGLPDYKRGGWRQFGVYYMPIAVMESQIASRWSATAEMKDIRQGSVAVAAAGTIFPAQIKTEIPRIVSLTIIDKKLLSKQAESVVRRLTGYGFTSPEKARPWQPRTVESLPPSPDDDKEIVAASPDLDSKRPNKVPLSFPSVTTYDNWGEVKAEKDGKSTDNKTSAAAGAAAVVSVLREWDDATCVGFEARIREIRRALFIAEVKYNENRKIYEPLAEELIRLETLSRTEDQVAITRRGIRRQTLQREHDSSMAITTARLKYIQSELATRKIDAQVIPASAINGHKPEDPKAAAKKVAAAKVAAAPAKMLLTPEVKAGPVDDGKHQFVLAPDPIAQAELKELDTAALRKQESQTIGQLTRMNHEFSQASEQFEKEPLPVGEVGQEVAAIRPRVAEANKRMAASLVDLSYYRSRLEAMPRMRVVPSKTGVNVEIVDFEWDAPHIVSSKY